MKTKSKILRILINLIEFFIFTDFLFIVAIVIGGGFEYRLINIFGTYVKSQTIVRPFVFFVVLIVIWKLLKHFYPERVFSCIFKNPYYYFIVSIIVYNALVIPSVLNQYYSFSLQNPQDVGLFHHAIYNTVHGNILRTDIFYEYRPFVNWNLLRDHYFFFLFSLVPIYYFFQQGSTLLVMQTFAISIGAVPIFLIACKKLKNKWWALFVSYAYLFHPLVIRLLLYDLRFEYFAIPLLLFAFYAIDKKKVWQAVVLLLLAALCKEEVLLPVGAIGVYVLFFKRKIKHHIWFGLLILGLISLMLYLYFVLFPSILGPQRQVDKILYRLSEFNNIEISWWHRFRYLLTQRKWEYFAGLFKHLGFIPLISPMILLALPLFIMNIMMADFEVDCFIWHSALIVPFLFISMIYALRYLIRNLKGFRIILYIWLTCFFTYFGIGGFYSTIIRPFLEKRLYLDDRPDVYKEFEKAVKFLPKGGSVFTMFCLLPNLSNRKELYWQLTCPDGDADYLFFSLTPSQIFRDEKRIIEDQIASGRYIDIYNSNNFAVMARCDLVEEEYNSIMDFSRGDDLNLWEINVCNARYNPANEKNRLAMSAYFSADGDQDEFIQMRRKDLNIDLKEYPYFFLDYHLENSSVQTIEIVFGIDTNNDGAVDKYVKGIYSPSESRDDRWIKYTLNMDGLPEAFSYRVIELEIYLHKIYGVDCSGKGKGWHKFLLGQTGFKTAKLK